MSNKFALSVLFNAVLVTALAAQHTDPHTLSLSAEEVNVMAHDVATPYAYFGNKTAATNLRPTLTETLIALDALNPHHTYVHLKDVIARHAAGHSTAPCSILHKALLEACALAQENAPRIEKGALHAITKTIDAYSIALAQDTVRVNSATLKAPRPPENPSSADQVTVVNTGPNPVIPLPRDLFIRNLWASEDAHVGHNLYVGNDIYVTGTIYTTDSTITTFTTCIILKSAAGNESCIIFQEDDGDEKARIYSSPAEDLRGLSISVDKGITRDLFVDQVGNVIISGTGVTNTIDGFKSFIGAGENNQITDSALDAAIVGGYSNTVSGNQSIVAGGTDNTITGTSSFIGGGNYNTASGIRSTIIGGEQNSASGLNSIVLGGYNNTASGIDTIAIGSSSTASGNFSVAVGTRAQATTQGSIVFADSHDSDFTDNGANTFNVRASGGIYLDGNVTVTGNVVPSADVTYNLGSPTLRWKDIYAQNITSTAGQVTIVNLLVTGTSEFVGAVQMDRCLTITGCLIQTSGLVSLGADATTNAISIGTGTTGGGRTISIGNATNAVTILGNLGINDSGGSNTTIGNGSSSIIIQGVTGIVGATSINTSSNATTQIGTGGAGAVTIGNTAQSTIVTGTLSVAGSTIVTGTLSVAGNEIVNGYVTYNNSQTNPLIPIGVAAANITVPNGPRVVTGSIPKSGASATLSYGISLVSYDSGAKEYTVTYAQAFTVAPIVLTTIQDTSGSAVTGADSAIVLTSSDTTKAVIQVRSGADATTIAQAFNIFAIGY